jgi:hypothetical protein
MVKPAFQTLLVTAIGFPTLFSSCFLAAVLATVSLPAITRSADVKDCPAPADSLAENDFGGHPVAIELDNGWPFMSGWKRYILTWRFTAATAQTPGRCLDPGVFSYRQRSTLHDPFSHAPPCADDVYGKIKPLA